MAKPIRSFRLAELQGRSRQDNIEELRNRLSRIHRLEELMDLCRQRELAREQMRAAYLFWRAAHGGRLRIGR